jgi:hypothetical protein
MRTLETQGERKDRRDCARKFKARFAQPDRVSDCEAAAAFKAARRNLSRLRVPDFIPHRRDKMAIKAGT